MTTAPETCTPWNCLKLDLPAGLTRDTAIPLVLVEDLRYAGRPAPQTNPPHLVYGDDGHDEHFTPCSGSGGKFAGGMVKYLGPPKFGRAYYAVTLPLKVSGSVDDPSSQCVTAQVFSSPKPEKDPPSLNWITGTGTPVEGWRNDTASSCLGPPDTSLGPAPVPERRPCRPADAVPLRRRCQGQRLGARPHEISLQSHPGQRPWHRIGRGTPDRRRNNSIQRPPGQGERGSPNKPGGQRED